MSAAQSEGSRYFYVSLECNVHHPSHTDIPMSDCVSKVYVDFDKCLRVVEDLATSISSRFARATMSSESPRDGQLLCLTVSVDEGWFAKCRMICEDTRGKTLH